MHNNLLSMQKEELGPDLLSDMKPGEDRSAQVISSRPNQMGAVIFFPFQTKKFGTFPTTRVGLLYNL